MRLLRRKKADDQDPAGSEPEGKEAVSSDGASAEPDDPEAVGAAVASPNGERAEESDDGPVDPAIAMLDVEEDEETPPRAAEPVDAAPLPPDGDGDERLPASFYFEGLLKNDRPASREELDRQAEADFHAAIAPSVSELRELVPDASSPEEALQELTQRWDDPLPDPEGENQRERDPFKRGPADTAVYYRIRRHFENPKRHVGFGREAWRPPPGLAGEPSRGKGRSRQALPSGQRSRRS